MKHFNKLLVIACLLPGGILPPSLAFGAEVVGYVLELEGDIDQVEIGREGESVPVSLLMELQAGDTLSVRHPDARVKIRLTGSTTESIAMDNSPYVVRGIGDAPSVAGNLLGWAGDWITGLYKDTEQERLVQAISRGGNPYLSAPLLEAEPLLITGPRSRLCLAWEGGVAPYELVLAGDNGRNIGHSVASDTATCLSALLVLDQAYSLVITDANGRRFSTGIEVVSPELLPKPPAGLESADLPAHMKLVIQASWLAAQPGQRWLFEAYQAISSPQQDDQVTRLVRGALEKGIAPDIPED